MKIVILCLLFLVFLSRAQEKAPIYVGVGACEPHPDYTAGDSEKNDIYTCFENCINHERGGCVGFDTRPGCLYYFGEPITGSNEDAQPQLQCYKIVSGDDVPVRKAVLMTQVKKNQNTNSGFWASQCGKIPEDAEYLKMVMGETTDYYKPLEGVSLCTMLRSWNQHLWSPDGLTWVQPEYYGNGYLGGTKDNWINQFDTRRGTILWGLDDSRVMGSLGTYAYDSEFNWFRMLDVYYVIPVKKESWTKRGDGVCPELQQRGATVDTTDAGTCRTRCDPLGEAYFTLSLDEDEDNMCTCYADCDNLTEQDNTVTYEVLSETVQILVYKEERELGSALEDLLWERSATQMNKLTIAECEENLEEKTSALTTCETNLAAKTEEHNDAETELQLWKDRFGEVQRLEDTRPLTSKALDAFPDPAAPEVSVSGSEENESEVGNPDCVPSGAHGSNRVLSMLFLIFGVAIGYGASRVMNFGKGSEIESLL